MYFYIGLIITLILLKLLRKYFNGPMYKGIKDVNKKIIIVTGSSAGIGKETAFDLLDNGATVIFACRDEKKTIAVINEIRNLEVRERAIFMKLDLCNIESVNDFAKEFKSYYNKLDILVNNAGGLADTFYLTQDNIELSLQSNHIGHMALTFLLLDIMSKEGRVINVSSIGHRRSSYNIDELKRLEANLEFKGEGDNYTFQKGLTQYGNTKLANIFFSQNLAEIFEKKYKHLKTASLHPGAVNTEFGRFVVNFPSWLKIIFYTLYPIYWFCFRDSVAGAQTTLSLCYIEFEKIENGQYYANNVRTDTYPNAKNTEVRDEFIKYSWMLIDNITKNKNFTIPRITI